MFGKDTENGQTFALRQNHEFDLSSLIGVSADSTNGFVINGIDGEDQIGSSVSSAGDVNGDGVDDLIIGARFQGHPNGEDK